MKKIKFIKEYRAIGDFGMPGKAILVRSSIGDTADNLSDEDAQWLIDNGFAEEVKESGWWKPSMGERYYYTDDSGFILYKRWRDEQVDRFRHEMGNCFKTDKATERYRDYLKAVATVRQDKGVLTPEQVYTEAKDNGEAYHVGYIGKQSGEKVLCVCRDDLYYWPPVGGILFDTEKHAQASLDKHPNEWETITNYDWNKE